MYQAIITSVVTSLEQIKTRSPTPFIWTIVLAVIAAFPFFLLGYDVAIGRAADLIEEDLSLTTDQIDHFHVTVHSCLVAGGAIAAGIAANFVGRKYTAAFGCGVYAVGAVVLAFAHGFGDATCGRALAGFGTGMGLLVGPIYIAEIAPASVRSYLGHFPQVMLALGMMAAYTMEVACTRLHPHTAWRLTVGLSAVPSLVVMALLCWIPDSPAWLVMLGKVDLAEELLEFCRGPKEEDSDDSDEEEEDHEVEDRMKQLKKVAGLDRYSTGNNVRGAPGRIIGVRKSLDDMFNDPIFRPLMKTILLLLAQEAIFDDLIYRSLPTIFELNSFSCCFSSAIAAALLAFIRMVSAILSARWANGVGGRKALLLVSIFLAGCSLGAFSATIFADARDHIGHGTAFALYSAEVVALEVVVGFGVGPYPWMYGPEAFSLPVRAPCLSYCIIMKFVFRVFLKSMVPIVDAPFEGIWAAFVLSSGIQILSFILCCLFVRDTSGQILVDDLD